MAEYWYHGGGCRAWLKVVRNTLTHDIKSVRPAQGAGAAQPHAPTAGGA
jgi:sarcosine oxidase subunit delta